jgi:enamine deaminase RidA (YjgF/YER057c/UK114 family)
MGRKNISSGSPFENTISFSRAVRNGNMISVSGTAPIKPDGSTAGIGDVYKQTKYCIDIIKNAINQANADLSDVIRTRIMLTDISRWREAARAHAEYFSDIKPACTFVEVKGFVNDEWLVEIEADCYLEL